MQMRSMKSKRLPAPSTRVRDGGVASAKRVESLVEACWHRWFGWLAAALVMLATATALNAADIAAPSGLVSFRREVAPVLQQKCVTCHGPEKSKGGYQLHTFESLMRSGDSQEVPVVPGDPERSQLYRLLVAKDADDRMPQKDDPLPAAQIALIERWIREGAKFDGPDAQMPLASLLAPTNHPAPPATYSQPVPILALAFSTDGTELAAGGHHEVTLWNPLDGTLLRRITNLVQQTHALSFSPDGSLLAACGGYPGRAGELCLLDPRGDSPRQTLVTAADCLLALAFSLDGRRLIVGGGDNVIRVFNVAGGREERRIEQHADWVMGLAFSPDGAQFASASRDKTARLFDAATGELQETYTGHAEAVFGVAFSVNGRFVLTGGRDKTIHAWQTNDAKKVFEVGGLESALLRLTAHGDQLFSCFTDGQVQHHRLADKKAELVRSYSGHRDIVYALAYHAATKRLATGGFDGEVRVWDTQNGELMHRFTAAPGYRGDSPASAGLPEKRSRDN
jgi:mono/diheme cytochrome c family protein